MIRWPAVLVFVLVSAGVRAEPATSLPPAEQQSLDAFAAGNASCLEWSDGCVVCVRQEPTAQDAGKGGFACSTPGIACTPTKLACRPSLPPPAPAPKP